MKALTFRRFIRTKASPEVLEFFERQATHGSHFNGFSLMTLHPFRRRLPTFAAILTALLLLQGCSGLVSQSEIRRSLGPKSFLRVADREVHVEVSGKGEPILLIHGFGGSTFSWRETLPFLAETHRVIALDLFGFGYTERPRRLQHYSRRGQLDLILGVLDHLNIDRAHVIGHSYGGGLAMTLAAEYPERVASLVLADTTAPNWAISRRRNVAEISPLTWLFVRGYALRPKLIRKALQRSWFDDSLVTDEVVEGYLKRLRIQGAARAYRGLTVPMGQETNERLVLVQDLTQPVLVIWGADDELIPVAEGELAANQMRDSRFVTIDDCGHSPMEEHPETFVHLVNDFLKEHSFSATEELAAADR